MMLINVENIKSSFLDIEKEVVKSFYIEDVTENQDKLHIACCMVATGYSRLSSRNIDFQEVYQELCHDPYYTRGLSKVLLLSGYNPDKEHVEPLGTLRIVLSSVKTEDTELAPLEAMDLFLPLEGWKKFQFEGFNLKEAFEFSRTAFITMDKIAVKIKLSVHIVDKITREAMRIATQEYQKKQAWAVLPRHFIKTLESANLKIIKTPNMSLNFPKYSKLFSKYDKYWLSGCPGFYKIIF